ncbi:MAG TPA: Crp/Fnr family transcriptional regulator [Sphingobium sp.]|uniref:Crp/Fnr family transcriptional regulator n=1 Tax=unclassified Sphingobium TaxID=2611147 RepID=UPI000A06E117|nr:MULTISPECIES: Crp/Fnr family transcriptional regulator [unclassified Sphingobium]WIW87075.1 Crp/Fnr family transcriptional regulator [Sphingobium sp. V4]HAF42844.1 Crp/Fnr family transcriptional regulator [Sphingobium sp.]
MEAVVLKGYASKIGRKLGLSSEEALALAEVACRQLRQLKPRQDIYADGDPASCVRIILDGWACRYHQFENGTRQIVQILMPGDIFGHDVAQVHQDHSACSLSPLAFAQLSHADFAVMTAQVPGIERALRWDLSMTLAIQRQWISTLGRFGATQRIAHLLCELYVRASALGTSGVKGRVDCPMAQRDIADCTGLSLVQVNRSINLLRATGLLYWRHRTLEITDLEALAKMGMFNPHYLGHVDGLPMRSGNDCGRSARAMHGIDTLPLFR